MTIAYPDSKFSPNRPASTLSWGFTAATVGLVLLTVGSFWPVFSAGFISLDDSLYVTKNPYVHVGFTSSTVRWAFTTPTGGYWIPLTWLSYMLDSQIWGFSPFAYHLGNVFWHVLTVLLLHRLLLNLGAGPLAAFFGAALFAIHPLRVESVAWVTERKDVLSGFFALLALLRYVEYCRTLRWADLFWTCVFWVLSLMAKPMLVTLPALLLLLDYWPLQRVAGPKWLRTSDPERLGVRALPLSRIVLEKVLLLPISAIFSYITLRAQASVGSMASLQLITPYARIANASVSYVRYVYKQFIFTHLGVYYPLVRHLPVWGLGLALLLLTLITAATLLSYRKRPWLAVGWLWFIGTLLPVSGLLQSGTQGMADRFTYFPSIGLVLLALWSIPSAWGRRPVLRALSGAGATLLLGVLAVATWHQCRYWHDSLSLYEHTIRVAGDSELMRLSMGQERVRLGDLRGAASDFRMAAGFEPPSAGGYSLLAGVESRLGDTEAARRDFAISLKLDPKSPLNWVQYAVFQLTQNCLDDALASVDQALRRDPDNILALNLRGYVLARKGRPDDAMTYYRRALSIDPENVDTLCGIANLLSNAGDTATAVELYDHANRNGNIELLSRINYAVDLAAVGRLDDAMAQYNRIFREAPDNVDAHTNAAAALLRAGRFEESAVHSQLVLKLHPDSLNALVNLASAQLNLGQTVEARQNLAKARKLAPGNPVIEELWRRATLD